MSRAWLIVLCVAACKNPDAKQAPDPDPVPSKAVATSKMVRVEAGWFASGCVELPSAATRADAVACLGDNPPRRLWVSAFEIDELEVTVEQYEACVAANSCSEPKYKDYQETRTTPVLVRFDQAAAYCSWRGQRIPTEAEWEKAARGTDGRMYPWGNERPTCETAALTRDPVDQRHRLRCNRRLSSVGTHAQDRSPYGAMDMAGNAPEWTSDLLVSAKGDWKDWQAPGVIRFADPSVIDPTGPSPEARAAYIREDQRATMFGEHVMRGGLHNAGVGVRSPVPLVWETDDGEVPVAGIRCARTAGSSVPPEHPPVPEATVDVTVDDAGRVTIRSTAL
jgi:formylglycine-generating enzyme required for sulfatase activity